MIDWAAKWFEIRAEMGQSDMATMMYQDKGKDLTRTHFHHREADGFGKIQSLLRDEGLVVQPPVRPLKKPSSISQIYWLLKGLMLHPRLPQNPWKHFIFSQPSGAPDDVSYWFLSEVENEHLKAQAKDRNLNVGFFILSELDGLIKERLYKNSDDWGTWLCPVDLRGAFQEPPISHNFVSFVIAQIQGSHNPTAIRQAFQNYKKELKARTYWAYWELAQIGKWIGERGVRWLAKKGTQRSYWMGSFSDLGIWDQQNIRSSHAGHRHWVIAPPGSPAYPVGITTIEWCGHRSITLKLHPAICDTSSLQLSEEILNQFKTRVLSQ